MIDTLTRTGWFFCGVAGSDVFRIGRSGRDAESFNLVLDTHKVNQDVVLGYWDQVLTTEPAELQAWIDDAAARIQVPCLAVFGRPATDGERERLGRLPDAQIEEWAGGGHFVHLVDPGRFAATLRTFVEHCDQAG